MHGVVHEVSHETEKRSFGHRRTGALCFVGVEPCHLNGNLLAFGLPINIFNDRSHHLETLRRLRAVDGFFLSGLHALERQQLTDEVRETRDTRSDIRYCLLRLFGHRHVAQTIDLQTQSRHWTAQFMGRIGNKPCLAPSKFLHASEHIVDGCHDALEFFGHAFVGKRAQVIGLALLNFFNEPLHRL